MALNVMKVKAKNYKSFGGDYMGFDEVKPHNLIIGKNNSGKSTLVDLLEYATKPSPRNGQGHKGKRPEFIYSHLLTEKAVDRAFRENANSGVHTFRNDNEYGKTLIGKEIFITLKDDGVTEPSKGLNDRLFTGLQRVDQNFVDNHSNRLVEQLGNPFKAKIFYRLSAERDIVREDRSIPGSGDWLKSTGDGATNLIRNVVNNRMIDDRYINVQLLNAINEIYGDDGQFSRVVPQEGDNGEWEIFLEEEKKGSLIPLSSSGSSLKTVILVLLNLEVLPYVSNISPENCIFAIEEPENNLHPSLQRRLIEYILEYQSENDSTFLISTHSNVFIDIFANNESSQILHVRHDGEKSTVAKIETYTERADLIDDLDFRASDVLQANGVIWVEGPSDRIYLKRWIDLVSDEEIKEDLHYQFVMYGGSLLKHLNADDPDLIQSAISVLRINKNSIIVMDSDKSRETDDLSQAKQSVIEALEDNENCLTIVTAGRDIENYLPSSAIQTYYELNARPRRATQFRKFEDYLDNVVGAGEGSRFNRSKALYAQRFAGLMDDKNDIGGLDIQERVQEIVDMIKKWNRISTD